MATKPIDRFDALGNEIVVGQPYGFTSGHGTFVYVNIGIAERLTPLGVTIRLTARYCSIYGRERSIESTSGSVNAKTTHMFPVSIEEHEQIKLTISKSNDNNS